MRFHHIGYLVPSIEDSEIPFKLLNTYPVSDVIKDVERGVLIRFYESSKTVQILKAMVLIELIQPIDLSSPLAPLLQKRKAGPYHLCYCGSAQDEAKLLGSGFISIQAPKPAIAFDGQKVGFYFSKTLGLIEVLYE
ncbi:MAG TPA: VOC family protein, partial [Thermotogota bacterium]|nr:VOC family protein [Thermotogota bacterium]